MEVIKLTEGVAESANIIGYASGTNCPKGGDSGYGGRTVIELKNEASTDWEITITSGFKDYVIQSPEKLRIVLGGDTECDTIIEALENIVKNLKGEIK